MRVFVTGGTGFVGSHVVEELIDKGHEPVCLVRETSDTTHLEALGVERFVGSLADVANMREVLTGVDAVIHVAGVIKVRHFDDFYRINTDATGELVELAAAANPNLQRFVFVSSIGARGSSSGPYPRPEELGDEPVSHYGKSKLAAEKRVQALADTIPLTIFRPPPVYGPRDQEMLTAFKMAKFGVAATYSSRPSFLSVIFVADLANAIVRALTIDHPSGSVYYGDDGQVHTMKSFIVNIGEVMGTRPRHLPVPAIMFHAAGHISEALGNLANRATIFNTDKVAEMSQPSWVCGHARLGRELDWQPQWSLEQGARRTAEWYREHGWL